MWPEGYKREKWGPRNHWGTAPSMTVLKATGAVSAALLSEPGSCWPYRRQGKGKQGLKLVNQSGDTATKVRQWWLAQSAGTQETSSGRHLDNKRVAHNWAPASKRRNRRKLQACDQLGSGHCSQLEVNQQLEGQYLCVHSYSLSLSLTLSSKINFSRKRKFEIVYVRGLQKAHAQCTLWSSYAWISHLGHQNELHSIFLWLFQRPLYFESKG